MGSPLKRIPQIIAHRGASYEAPENTLAAFDLAWLQNADGIEGDYRLTEDHQIVCIHDSNTKRTGNQQLTVSKNSLQVLKQIDVGSWKNRKWSAERIPTLQEVFVRTPIGKQIVIEIKSTRIIVPVLIKALKAQRNRSNQITIISFHQSVVREVKKALPQIKALLIIDPKWDVHTKQLTPSASALFNKIKTLSADGLSTFCHPRIDANYIRPFLANNLMLNTWTVDDLQTASRFAELGFHSISTNRPELLRAHFK